MKYKVYLLTSPSGKKYIGYTGSSMERRLHAHARHARAGKYPLAYAIRKYGIDRFKVRILRKFSRKAEAQAYEILSIKRHKSMIKGFGYNATPGGENPSRKFGGRFWMKGKSKEELIAIGRSKARYGDENGFKGHTHSKASMDKMVNTRRANGSYDVASGAYTVMYKRKKYTSKKSLMRLCGLTRTTVERLMESGEVKILRFSASCLTLSGIRSKKVKYNGKEFESLQELRDTLGCLSYGPVYRLISTGDACYV